MKELWSSFVHGIGLPRHACMGPLKVLFVSGGLSFLASAWLPWLQELVGDPMKPEEAL